MSAAVALPLADPRATDPGVAGGKAASLARLLRAGLPVHDGVVVPTAVQRDGALPQAVAEIAGMFGPTPLAVRSSAVAEDTPDASFAGLYMSVLDVRGAAQIADAITRCWASTRDAAFYSGGGTEMAVLVQPLLAPRAAGAAFGDVHGAVSLSAVPGRAAGLMAGEVASDEWRIWDIAEPLRLVHHAVDAADVKAVAALTRRVAAELGGPVEIEWALCEGAPVLLQARPLTSQPCDATWTPPGRGEWRRDIRLGEWLPDPVTPLFATWFLPAVDRRFRATQNRRSGVLLPRPAYALVNGWYYHSPLGDRRSSVLLRGMFARPRFALGMMLGRRQPRLAHRLVVRAEIATYQDVLTRYRTATDRLEAALASADDHVLLALVDELVDIVGEYTWSLTILGGAAWRTEYALARLYGRFVRPAIGGSYIGLLAQPRTDTSVAGHAVSSLDWVHPTLGELALPTQTSIASSNEAPNLDAAYRQALAGHPCRSRRFAATLALARASATCRAACGADLTLAWPALRGALRRLGTSLRTLGCIPDAEDVFFLERDEVAHRLRTADGSPLDDLLARRRATWTEQRRLRPPSALGVPACLLPLLVSSSVPPATRRPSAGVLRGIGVSPGRVTGRARVLHQVDPTTELADGDILVVRAFVPALAPLLTRAAGVAADVGSVAAHTSVLAREYGVPGVVGLGTATHDVCDGQLVTVDGTAGTLTVRI
jgi:pyruvate,water dikinase